MLRSVWLVVLVTGSFAAVAQADDPVTRLYQYAHTAWRVQDGSLNGPPTAIAQTSDGYLWIGTSTGLLHFDGVRFVPWASSSSASPASLPMVYTLLGGSDGSLWIGTGSN